MKITTWNVNSLNVRLPHVLGWLAENPVDALGIQETKLTDDKFPVEALREAGYQVVFRGQKTYNGVAIVSLHAIEDVSYDIPGFEDEQKRVIAGTIQGVRVINVYVPNGSEVGSEKYAYKLRWLAALRDYVADEMSRQEALAVTGDYNIAPGIDDTHDPDYWEGNILCSDQERDAFQALLDLGLTDSFRLFEHPEKTFSWWDYRKLGFQLNKGLRIDHVLVSEVLRKACTACAVDRAPRKLERPSDHAPVTAEFDR